MRRRVTGVAVGCLALVAVGAGWRPAGAQTVPDLGGLPPDKACAAVFTPGAFGGFLPAHKAAPGEPISVDVRWEAQDFTSRNVELISCVSKGGILAGGSGNRLAGVDNDGGHRIAFAVPDDAEPGTSVCQRAAVIGTGAGGAPNLFKPRAVCYAVTAASSSKLQTEPGASDVKATEVVPAADAEVAGPPVVAGKTETPPTASAVPAPAPALKVDPAEDAAPQTLARTGATERLLFFAAGVLFSIGGLAAMFGARRLTA